MPINELSDRRRLPRLGKIHLGIKVKTDRPCKCRAKSANKQPLANCRMCEGTGFMFRPKETDYFVCPKEIQELYGEKPTELPIMFPVEHEEVFFQQFYKRYGFGVLKCIGDGKDGRTWDEEQGGFVTTPCPCHYLETKKCSILASLQFLLPDVPGAGVWQINTGSKNSVIDINSGIDYIRSMCGRVKMIPLILKREPRVIQRSEKGQAKTGTHYTLQLNLANVSLRELQTFAAIPASRALLPPPDETEDELFFPPGGWSEKNGEELIKEEKSSEKELEKKKAMAGKEQEMKKQGESFDAHKQELSFILKQYRHEGGKMTQKEEDELDALESIGDYKRAITNWRPRRDKLMGKPPAPENSPKKESKKSKTGSSDQAGELFEEEEERG